jgi:hypothetical protein
LHPQRVLFFLLFLISYNLFAFTIQGDTSKKFFLAMKGQTLLGKKKPLPQALIRIYADTSSNLVQRIEADEQGWVAFQIPLQKFYTIKISKTGYVTKIFTVDAHMPKSMETGDYYFEFGMDIFEEVPGLDVSMLKEPVAKIFFNTFTKNFDYDYNYTAKINNDIKVLYKNYDALKKKEKNNPQPKQEQQIVKVDSAKTSPAKSYPGVTFSVELLNSEEQIEKNSAQFKGIVNVKEYKDNNTYHYYIGEYPTLNSAEKMKENMRLHFPNANIIGFKDGKKLSAEEVFNLVDN